MTTSTRPESNGKARKSLADQIDRLDALLGGLDAALAGAVSDAVEQGVRQAVQAVMAEFLTNRQLHEQLRRAAQPAGGETTNNKGGLMSRMWSAAGETLSHATRLVSEAGKRGGALVMAAGVAVVGGLYVARATVASAASFVFGHAMSVVGTVGAALAGLLPTFGFCGI